MLLADFTIPSAVFLSVFFLKIAYRRAHYLALFLCLCGMSMSICNDLFVKKQVTAADGSTKNQLIGDIMALGGAFLYASSNILQEHFLKSTGDVFHYLGFLGLFGLIISLVEAIIFAQLSEFMGLIQSL